MKDLSSHFKSVETAVRYILAHYPEARNNDKLLILIYWEMVDKIPIPPNLKREILYKATNPETIRRARQKIQESGDYLPSKEVQEKRRRLREEYIKTLTSYSR